MTRGHLHAHRLSLNACLACRPTFVSTETRHPSRRKGVDPIYPMPVTGNPPVWHLRRTRLRTADRGGFPHCITYITSRVWNREPLSAWGRVVKPPGQVSRSPA